ncbi:hypothetical protein LCGC14_0815560 [marine sediment metagenome]|uniref:Uncharacterized protein n=1 Tax=marine sediment metagenome TaxID=412755 RepID=A0A0F9S5D8_9ZZZZ
MKPGLTQWFDGVIHYYTTILKKTEKLHDCAIEDEWVDLGCTTKALIKATNNTLHIFNNMREAMIETDDSIETRIEKQDLRIKELRKELNSMVNEVCDESVPKPVLKLVVNNGPIKTNFKRSPKNNS